VLKRRPDSLVGQFPPIDAFGASFQWTSANCLSAYGPAAKINYKDYKDKCNDDVGDDGTPLPVADVWQSLNPAAWWTQQQRAARGHTVHAAAWTTCGPRDHAARSVYAAQWDALNSPRSQSRKEMCLTGEKYDWLTTWSLLGTAKWLTASCRGYDWRRRLCINFVVCYCVSYAVHDIVSGPTAPITCSEYSFSC